ncbi:MAG: hypothetical protein WA294_02410 [Acidobacteriaceae bacterium]
MTGDTAMTTEEAWFNYHGTMDYGSAVRDLFERLPDLEPMYREQFSYLADEELPYVVFGSFLVPVLEIALKARDAGRVTSICAYIEEAAEDARTDAQLENLLRVEIGEWLSGTELEADVAPYLGEQTERVSGYVLGLATQRISPRTERERRDHESRLLDGIRRK